MMAFTADVIEEDKWNQSESIRKHRFRLGRFKFLFTISIHNILKLVNIHHP